MSREWLGGRALAVLRAEARWLLVPPDEGGWAGAMGLWFRCSDEEQILSVRIRRDRFARRDPGFIGERAWVPRELPREPYDGWDPADSLAWAEAHGRNYGGRA